MFWKEQLMFSQRLSLGFSLVEVLCSLCIFTLGILAVGRLNALVMRESFMSVQMEHLQQSVLSLQDYLHSHGITEFSSPSPRQWSDQVISSEGRKYFLQQLTPWFDVPRELRWVVCRDEHSDARQKISWENPECTSTGPWYLKIAWKQPSGQVWVYGVPVQRP
jgi:Tfp pilus assembly protein PilV